MTENKWKPGDVAMVECSDGNWRRAAYRRESIGNPEAWEFQDGSMRRVNESRTRPLVVIDPEDREQVEQLAAIYANHGVALGYVRDDDLNSDRADSLQAALRSLITPPKPEEPTGLGAVVEDDKGGQWVRAGQSHKGRLTDNWRCSGGERVGWWSNYADIDVVRVLSEGVTA